MPMKPSQPRNEPVTPLLLLTVCLTERNPSIQRLPLVDVRIRIDIGPVPVREGTGRPGLEIRRAAEVAVFRQPSRHQAEPRRHSIERGAMHPEEMGHMLMPGGRQGSALATERARARHHERDTANLRYHPAHVRVRRPVNTVGEPVPPGEFRRSAREIFRVPRAVNADPCRSRIADQFAGGHDERGDRGSRHRTDVVLPAPGGACSPGWRDGKGPAKRLHARLLVGADHRPTPPARCARLGLELGNHPGPGPLIGILDVEPPGAAVRRNRLLDPGPSGSSSGFGPGHGRPSGSGRPQSHRGPPGGRTILWVGGAADEGGHIDPPRRRKPRAVGSTAEHPAAQPNREPDGGFARSRWCGDRDQTRRRLGGRWAGR